MVPRLDTLHSLAHALHSAGGLMPQDAGEQAFWVCMGCQMAAFLGLQLHVAASSAPALTWIARTAGQHWQGPTFSRERVGVSMAQRSTVHLHGVATSSGMLC